MVTRPSTKLFEAKKSSCTRTVADATFDATPPTLCAFAWFTASVSSCAPAPICTTKRMVRVTPGAMSPSVKVSVLPSGATVGSGALAPSTWVLPTR